jgi:S1-C subfamily serine protease
VTSTGPISAERSLENTYGIMNPSRRFMTMNEVLLENNLPTLGGSLLFNMNGQLAGVLNAALGLTDAQNSQRMRTGDVQDISQTRGGGGGLGAKAAPGALQYGPGVLTAAYTVGPKVLRRVVSGFLSDDHVVRHPTVGIFCKNSSFPQGALIDSVTKGSAADKAGMIKGDLIISMNNVAVQNQIDFLRILADQEVGDTLKIWVQGAAGNRMFVVEVGT